MFRSVTVRSDGAEHDARDFNAPLKPRALERLDLILELSNFEVLCGDIGEEHVHQSTKLHHVCLQRVHHPDELVRAGRSNNRRRSREGDLRRLESGYSIL